MSKQYDIKYIDIRMAAQHLNFINDNSLWYTINAAKNGGNTWTHPFNKPQLLHHDKLRDPVGRVRGYTVKNNAELSDEPSNYVELDIRITDSDAIDKILNGLYLTGSVGSKGTHVSCSECGQVFNVDGLCPHKKGSLNDNGEKIYWIIDEIQYTENSFVNNPADPYSRIVSIDIGSGPIPYKEFLDNKESLLSELTMESFSMIKDSKLTAESRKKLSSNVFCGPDRTFPAQDEAHIKAGLALVDSMEISEDAKNKIKGSLYRKGKRFGIVPSEDILQDNPNLITFRLDDSFTDEEVKVISDYFKENPDADLPELTDSVESEDSDEDGDDVVVIEDFEEVKTKTKKEVLVFTDSLIKKFESDISDKDSKITSLEDSINKLNTTISDNESILNSKEDEILKFLDQIAVLETSYKESLVKSVVDLKCFLDKTSDRKELEEKYLARKIDSLIDTINDLRNEAFIDSNIEDRVEDPTLNVETANEDADTSNADENIEDSVPENVDPKFATFYK